MALTPEFISAIAATAAAIVAILAALAAFRSARAAERTAETAALAERRSMLREIVSSAQGIIDEAQSIETLGGQLRAQHATLCTITENIFEGSAKGVPFDIQMSARLDPVAPVIESARGLADDYSGLSAASTDDLSKTQARLTSDLAKLRNLRADLRSELDDLLTRCQFAREPRNPFAPR